MSQAHALVQVENLRKYFPITRGILIQRQVGAVKAVDGITFSINRGEALGLVGDLARGAQCLLCEASFLNQDRAQAERTGHLTTRACGEIAAAAGVRYLVPFHFSRRYESEPWRVYEEIAAVCPQVVIPKG